MKKEPFLKTRLNCALVFRSDIEGIQKAKETLASLGVELIYQKISTSKLFIEESHQGGDFDGT